MTTRRAVVAFDSFKGSLSAREACAIASRALRSAGWEVSEKPMADGGEGTAAALVAAMDGEWIPVRVSGPLPGREVSAGFGWFPESGRALVEMAAASGLTLLQRDELNPMRATTRGTGELVREAAARGARAIWLAVGGSATVDGGVGAAMALGWRFLDRSGHPVGEGGGELARIARIAPPSGMGLPPVEVLCDVDNPLCGENGAARVFGPQKGATPAMVDELDAGLRHLAAVIRTDLGADVLDTPGAGAAGGLAAGAIAFMGGRLVPGIETVMRASGLSDALCGADWVVTGEGSFDRQSMRGKVVSGVVRQARAAGVRVAVIAGGVAVPESEYRAFGVDRAWALRESDMSVETAMSRAPDLLAARAAQFVEYVSHGG